MKNVIVTFGEIMGRICPPGHARFRQALPGGLEWTFAGAEANVAANVALLGGASRFVTALPDNPMAMACVHNLRGIGVDTSRILTRASGRLGLYFVEHGAGHRSGNVIYDREGSTFSCVPPEHYDWEDIFKDASWLHLSGITPAVSEKACMAAMEAVKAADERGIKVSLDLNFRSKLWRWDPSRKPRNLAKDRLLEMFSHVSLLIGSPMDCSELLGISSEKISVSSDMKTRNLLIARELCHQFPNISYLALTMRETLSAGASNWGAFLYSADNHSTVIAPLDDAGNYLPYRIRETVDRLGTGDSFAAGLLYALSGERSSKSEEFLSFAAGCACLAHYVRGDFKYITREEVERLIEGNPSGQISR